MPLRAAVRTCVQGGDSLNAPPRPPTRQDRTPACTPAGPAWSGQAMWVRNGATAVQRVRPGLTSLVPAAAGTCGPRFRRREQQLSKPWEGGRLLPGKPERRHRTCPRAVPLPGLGWRSHNRGGPWSPEGCWTRPHPQPHVALVAQRPPQPSCRGLDPAWPRAESRWCRGPLGPGKEPLGPSQSPMGARAPQAPLEASFQRRSRVGSSPSLASRSWAGFRVPVRPTPLPRAWEGGGTPIFQIMGLAEAPA